MEHFMTFSQHDMCQHCI